MSRYGLPDGGAGYVLSYYTIGQSNNVLDLPLEGGNVCNPSEAQLLAAGYFPVVAATYDSLTEKLGADKLDGSEIHPEVITMDAQEIADVAAVIADEEELVTEIAASVLNGLTFTQAENYIETNVTDLATAKDVLKKFSKAILILNKKVGVE